MPIAGGNIAEVVDPADRAIRGGSGPCRYVASDNDDNDDNNHDNHHHNHDDRRADHDWPVHLPLISRRI